MEGVGIVLFRGADQGVFQIGNETVVALEQGEIDLDALPDARIEKPLGDAVAIGGIGKPPRELGDLVLRARVLNVGEQLNALIDAGYGKRLMFGSDQMIWPEAIGMAIEGIESATFLTPEQKRDIFFNNAVRFFRLEERLQ